MNVGICHFRVGGLDGVSLEIAKWKKALEELGHRVHLCAGSLGGEGFLIPELDPEHPSVQRVLQNSFVQLAELSEEGLREELEGLAAALERELEAFLRECAIELLIVENIWSLPANPPAALALWKVAQRRKLPVIAHHHDFYWEKPYYRPSCSVVAKLLMELFPPRGPRLRHVVINTLAEARLREEGVPAVVIPNVFDFGCPPWVVDDFNHDFKRAIGVREGDILVLQATRIIRRKGIELAIELVRELERRLAPLRGQRLYDGRLIDEQTRAVLILANRPERVYLEDVHYLERLKERIGQEGIEARFIGDLIGPQRGITSGRKSYSFWDAYVFADLISYPSLQEGWGNQLLEAVFARKPLVIFEYEVFRADIKPRGFKFISLGSELIRDEGGLARAAPAALRAAADEALKLLTDADARREVVEHNFQVGRRFYSLELLKERLQEVLAELVCRPCRHPN